MPLALRRISKILEFREILEDFESFSRAFRELFEDFEEFSRNFRGFREIKSLCDFH